MDVTIPKAFVACEVLDFKSLTEILHYLSSRSDDGNNVVNSTEVVFSKYTLKSKIEELQLQSKSDVVESDENLQLDVYDQAKRFIRGTEWSIYHPSRTVLWIELCKNLHKETFVADSLYEETCNQLENRNVSIPSFVDRKHLYSHNLNENGYQVCMKILSAVSVNHPAITYAPTIYSVCAILAHYISDKSVLYNCIESLVVSRAGKMIYQTKLRFHSSTFTLIRLLKRHARPSYIYIKKLANSIDHLNRVFRNWIWWIFRDLPFGHVIRVMDCFLLEGNKVMYRFAIAIVMLFHKYTGNYENNVMAALKIGDLGTALSEFTSKLPVSAEKLLKVAFKIRNFKSSEINALELENEMISKSQCVRSPSSNSNRSVSVTALPTGMTPSVQMSSSFLSLELTSDTLAVKETRDISKLRTHSSGNLILSEFTSLINSDQLASIWSWIPPRITTMKPKIVYSTNEHGSSLISFFMMAEKYEPTIIIVKTTNKELIGAYCSGSWMERHELDDSGNKKTYFATGESFLFCLQPKIHKFPWIGIKNPEKVTHSSHLFMMASDSGIAIGGGGGSHGLWLDKDLTLGSTGHCDTFDNPALTAAAHDDFSVQSSAHFTCSVVEVIAFSP